MMCVEMSVLLLISSIGRQLVIRTLSSQIRLSFLDLLKVCTIWDVSGTGNSFGFILAGLVHFTAQLIASYCHCGWS